MQQFEYSSLIHAPVVVVWRFHERPDVLDILTPPWQPVQVVRRQGGLAIGALSEFRLFLGPISTRWLVRHVECEEFRLFTDVQEQGPFASWRHRHCFKPQGDKTRLTDSIEYRLALDTLTTPLLGWLIRQQLESLFRYRHEVTQKECRQW
ncbi:MAG: SRPBCC family protein [Leptolyngbyaceae cyanobacterium SM1_1_3]|nr:SRPBCC family protein [Leptolyngbyaceae cyanobacterium SM1_1_3]NJN02158.1 SRPBCC family protein [Leptolyngbyaceae cyanobacterium RM1_1_2]NJO08960.1 SRPBCC family protein [Leptolyngbyaceae cyanobacterium SL_1_1]